MLNVKADNGTEHTRKRRKTSTPPLNEDVDDLGDEGQYDEDGREILLSSGGRAVGIRSPNRKSRAKDEGWTDLDAEDEGDSSMVSEYVVDAFNYMLAIEVSRLLFGVLWLADVRRAAEKHHAQRRLHDEASRAPVEDAGHPHGLAH